MDVVLNKYLPLELGDIISKMVWEMNMKKVHHQLKYNVVWIRYENQLSFIVSNNTNSYSYIFKKWDNLTEIRSNKYVEFAGWY